MRNLVLVTQSKTKITKSVGATMHEYDSSLVFVTSHPVVFIEGATKQSIYDYVFTDDNPYAMNVVDHVGGRPNDR